MRTVYPLNRRGHVALTSLALVGQMPAAVRLRETVPLSDTWAHEGTWCGTYGSASADKALWRASSMCEAGKHHLQIRTWVRLRALENCRGAITREIAEASGFLNVNRGQATFLDELLGPVLAGLSKKLDAST